MSESAQPAFPGTAFEGLDVIPFAKVLDTMDATAPTIFTEAHPFPYIVFDGLFDPAMIDRIHGQFRDLPDDYWEKNNDQGIEVKWRSKWRSEYSIPEPAREIVRFLNSGIFLKSLAKLTGIPNLIPDPYYTGGGLNLIQRGGYLDVQRRRQLARRHARAPPPEPSALSELRLAEGVGRGAEFLRREGRDR